MYFFNQMQRLLFEGSVFLLGKPTDIDDSWKRARMSNTVMTVRHCQQYTQPLSPAVSHENELFNTNSSNASSVIVVRNYSNTCVCVLHIPVVATIRGWRLLEEIQYIQICTYIHVRSQNEISLCLNVMFANFFPGKHKLQTLISYKHLQLCSKQIITIANHKVIGTHKSLSSCGVLVNSEVK